VNDAAEADQASGGSYPAFPVVRLRPNKGKAYLGGHPWVYRDELVLDRRTSALAPGSVALIRDAKRVDVGLVTINPASGIVARELVRGASELAEGWIAERLARALRHRERLFDRPVYRLFHAEADGLPGLVIDRYGDVLVIQPNTAWAEEALPEITAAVDALLCPETIIVNRQSRGREQEGLSSGREILKGSPPDVVEVVGPCTTLLADLEAGQKTGLYLDQFANHARLADLSKGARVLDVFANTGGFCLSALARGAEHAVAVDGSELALDLLKRAANANGVAERLDVRQADAFDAMRALRGENQRFGVVICDPPAFAPRKASLEAGLRAYGRISALGIPLVETGGYFALCSCGRLFHSGGAGPDHPVHPALPEGGYLKIQIFALD